MLYLACEQHSKQIAMCLRNESVTVQERQQVSTGPGSADDRTGRRPPRTGASRAPVQRPFGRARHWLRIDCGDAELVDSRASTESAL